jgi:hypothetical protein
MMSPLSSVASPHDERQHPPPLPTKCTAAILIPMVVQAAPQPNHCSPLLGLNSSAASLDMASQYLMLAFKDTTGTVRGGGDMLTRWRHRSELSTLNQTGLGVNALPNENALRSKTPRLHTLDAHAIVPRKIRLRCWIYSLPVATPPLRQPTLDLASHHQICLGCKFGPAIACGHLWKIDPKTIYQPLLHVVAAHVRR